MWLLALVILLPTACVLWFMTQAMQNERLAVQQKLIDVYQGQLAALREQLDEHWAQRALRLADMAASLPPSQVFARCVGDGLADSVIVFDRDGAQVYPAPATTAPLHDSREADAWAQAQRLERRDGEALQASQVYADIASRSDNPTEAARALQAQARCLARAGQTDDAVALLTQTLAQEVYQHAVDAQGRLIVASAELRALQLIDNPEDEKYQATAQRLAARLTDYRNTAVPSPQRRFLMTQLRSLAPGLPESPLLEAETLAAQWVAAAHPDAPAEAPPHDALPPGAPPDGDALQKNTAVAPSALPGVWALPAGDGRVIALYRADHLRQRVRDLPAVRALPQGVAVEVLPPGAEPAGLAPVVASAGVRMPGWRLSLSPGDGAWFDASAEKRVAAYLWIGVLAIAATLAMAALIAWVVRRQIRVARLKNDLVATVSHELKTPLASMRLLIDTLLDAETFDRRQVGEYLHLIARENTRLSRLIENFLTFSRLEQNRYAFKPTDIAPLDIVDAAAAAVRDRFGPPECRFEIEAAPDLPQIVGDPDALVTAVVNLLDNAYKYSEEEKHIILRASAGDGCVCFEVQDHGIGISRVGSGRVFKRFYQVDQRLSGSGSGVGLGLSIVRAIVLAHGGSVELHSEPGRGSTFTLKIPAASDGANSTREARPDAP